MKLKPYKTEKPKISIATQVPAYYNNKKVAHKISIIKDNNTMTTEKSQFYQNYIQDNLIVFLWSGSQEIYNKLDQAFNYSDDFDFLKKTLDAHFSYDVFNKEQNLMIDQGHSFRNIDTEILVDRVILNFKNTGQHL